MNSCKVCGKDVWHHREGQVQLCMEELGLPKVADPMALASLLSVPILFNSRHKTMSYDGGPTWVSENLDLDILRCCLIGEQPEEKKRKKKYSVVPEEPKTESGDFLSITLENVKEMSEDSTNVEGE